MRMAVGLPVASLWPLTVPYLTSSQLRAGLATAISALYVLSPQIPSASSLILLAATVTVSAAFWPSSDEAGERADTSWRQRLSTYSPIIAALLLGLVAAALADIAASKDALEEAVESNRAAVVGAGLVVAVFLGGSVVARILEPFAHALEDGTDGENLPSLENAGRYIGWFERAVLFGLVIGGEPEAAAIALAAKSFARFPSLSKHQEGFAEYFLIGSLASLTIAVAVAAATRAALGIGPF
ncbi:MAG TPA: hypothetical protein VFX35_06820 [Solirubrobacterales bacterium]|nr:hypothetical protein [Solirubrobacterales bacterium]